MENLGPETTPPRAGRDPVHAYAKPKTIYLQLEHFSFFHGPSQIGSVDQRFIGRTAITAKLRALLTNSATRSGAYLVTGYRGMGKSSVVNKALNDINPYQRKSERSSRYFRILFLLMLLAVLGPLNHWFWFLVVPSILALTALLYVLGASTLLADIPLQRELLGRRPAGRVSEFRPLRFIRMLFNAGTMVAARWARLVLGMFAIDEPAPAFRARVLTQDFLVVWGIHVFALGLLVGDTSTIAGRCAAYLTLFVVLLVGNAMWRYYRPQASLFPSSDKNPAGTSVRGASFWKRAGQAVVSAARHWIAIGEFYVAYSNQVHIRLNLGYDKLSELDVLRLVAKNVESKYVERMHAFAFPQVPRTLAKLAILFCAVGLILYHQTLYPVHRRVACVTGLMAVLPTQALTASKAEQRLMAPAGDLHRYLDQPQFAAMRGCLTPPDMTRWRGRVHGVAIYADYLIFSGYRMVRDQLLVAFAWAPVDGSIAHHTRLAIHDDFRVPPRLIDYQFWIYFIAGWLLMSVASRHAPFGLVTHAMIIARLRRLNALIQSQVTEERAQTTAGAQFPWPWQRRRTTTFPRADEREIEKQLLDILDDIDRIPRITQRPEFIFILDELDKIEPHQNVSVWTKEEEKGLAGKTGGPGESARTRQQNVLRLLANLKHFLTTAKAKFIFIAGRELFDASLADVSDRNFFMGSIFNEVIYVESFLKDRADEDTPAMPSLPTALLPGSIGTDHPPGNDITTMTERYVCRFLLPATHFKPADCTLTTYARYVRGYFPDDEAAARKVVQTVSDFIRYLTYRSNGAPKKLSAYFEHYVTRCVLGDLADGKKAICAGDNSDHLYLVFEANDQYTFATASYLVTPFFVSLDHILRNFGDKLLVSSSFLIDHLYKFHRAGFSWRTIELTPEILDINRAPHLREMIGTIIRFLTQGHLQCIDNGLYNFKFKRKISEEITLLSKLNEREAAAFNFTLDESLATKQHYERELRELEKAYAPYFSGGHQPEFIRSISFLHMILGDLHFYDDEFDNAIVEYMEAVQLFGDDAVANLPFELFVVFVRNTLKLGLAFERRRTYESAYMTYGKLTSRIAKFKEIRACDVDFPARLDHPADIERWVTEDPLTSKKEYVRFRGDVMGSLRLLYQPAVAKFQILEKVTAVGVTARDVEQVRREFDFVTDGKASALAEADFLKRVGDILFYKNELMRTPEGTPVRFFSSRREAEAGRGRVHCLDADALCAPNPLMVFSDEKTERRRGLPLRPACQACEHYMRGLNRLCAEDLRLEEPRSDDRVALRLHDLMLALGRRWQPPMLKRTEPVLRAVARALSDLGDVFLTCADSTESLSAEFLVLLSTVASNDPAERKAAALRAHYTKAALRTDDPKRPRQGKIEEAFLYAYMAGAFLGRAGDHSAAAWQFTKMLYMLRDYAGRQRPAAEEREGQPTYRANIDRVAASLTHIAEAELRAAYDDSYRTEERRLGDLLGLREQDCRGLALWESNELELVNEWLRHNLLAGDAHSSHTRHRPLSATSPARGMYNRIIDLTLQAKVNRRRYKELFNAWEHQNPMAENKADEAMEVIGHLHVRDSASIESARKANELIAELKTLGRQGAVPRKVVEQAIRAVCVAMKTVVKSALGADYEAGALIDGLMERSLKGPLSPEDTEFAAERLRSLTSGDIRQKICGALDVLSTLSQLGVLPLQRDHRDVNEAIHLIADSVYCLTETVKLCGLYGPSYIFNHTVLANAHRRLAKWCERLSDLGDEAAKDVTRELNGLIDSVQLSQLTANYHAHMAARHYRLAIEMHRGGRAYRETIEEMVYLNDDFNDEHYHFCAALERSWLNTLGLNKEGKEEPVVYIRLTDLAPLVDNDLRIPAPEAEAGVAPV